MQKEQIEELVRKYFNNTATSEELDQLSVWYRTTSAEEVEWFAEIQNEEEILKAAMLKHIRKEIGEQPNRSTHKPSRRIAKLWPRIAAAAAVLLIVGLGVFFYINSSRHVILNTFQDLGLASNDIKPGSNKAYLVLSNGKRLSLTDAASGELAKEAGVEITKTADGQVVYTAPGDPGLRGDDSGALNTIETPKGGQYQIRLPDGSKVWLNAASKLIYPVIFTGRGQRVVTLSGEAYFEVAKDKRHPFQVKSAGQIVTVLGTHFNINSYTDEAGIKTTLLEGSVQVSGDPGLRQDDGVVLKPGEQATLTNKNINVAKVNAEDAVLWKNGKFSFDSEEIGSIMRQISRWYDVDIYFKDPVQTVKVSGSVSRFANISTLLDKLEQTGLVHFKIEGRKITVTK